MAGTRNSPAGVSCSLVAEAFGDVLEGARKRRNLGPDLVAARAGISVAHLYKIEHAQTQPRLSVLFRVADAVGVSPGWLLDEVITWLVPRAIPRVMPVAGTRVTAQEAHFVHQLIYGAHARIRR